MNMNQIKIKILITCSVFAFACSSKGKNSEPPPNEKSMKNSEPATLADLKNIDFSKPSQMNIALSEGDPDADIPDRNKIANAEKLGYTSVEKILAKLHPIEIKKEDQVPFRKRADSLPTPKTGTIVKTNFPSDNDLKPPVALAADHDALGVLRVQPEGAVPIVPQISITFNQPMVEITSHDDTIAKGVPVKITPEVEGKWRWVGSKTLLFDPISGRLPMATKFVATIPAGVKSAAGDVLAAGKTFSFQTPPPTVTNTWPHHGTRGLDQLIFVGFDQKIDPNEIAKHLEITSNGDTIKFVQAEPELANADPEILSMTDAAKPNTFVVVRSKSKLPYNSSIQVNVKEGTPSAEGPIPTTNNYIFSFRTYGALKVLESECGYRDNCLPNSNFRFRLSNAVDNDTFDESWVTVTPDFPNKTISVRGDWVYVSGLKPGRRTYTVEFLKDFTDKFEQKIQGKRTYKFDVGPSSPVLYSTAGTFTVLDPNGEPGVTIYSTNYKKVSMEVYEVAPSDWFSFLKYSRDYSYYGKQKLKAPGKRIEKRTIIIAEEPDDLVETFISLKKNMGKNNLGNLVIRILPISTTSGTEMPSNPPRIRNWVQSTQIGLDAMSDAGNLTAWATRLKDGKPLEGVKFELTENNVQAKSNAAGIAKIPLTSYDYNYDASEILIASKGDDSAFLPHSLWNGSWRKSTLNDSLSWFVFDDRKMYKPSEKVSVKGWIRAIENKKGGGVKLDSGARKVSYVVNGPRGNKITSGVAEVGALGGFDLNFDLPSTPNLGQANIELTAVGAISSASPHYHFFQIQEFRTPEFEVKTDAGMGPHYADESTNVNVSAQYYAGGALGAAETNWSVNSNVGSFRPPNQDGYSFGVWTPWWGWRYGGSPQSSNSSYKTYTAKTDAAGMHNLKLDFSKITPPRPLTVTSVATVMDVNRQAWTSSKSFIVHPSAFYIGMKTDKYFVKKGAPLDVELILSDVTGKIVSNRPIKIKASRVLHKWDRNKYVEIEKDPQECEVMSKDSAVKCTFETKEGGRYKIEASTMDDQGRENYSQITRWVSGGKVPKSRRVELEKVDLIPDKEEYQPGDMVELLVQSPIVPAEGMLTIRRSGLVEEKRFTMSESTMILNVPVKESYLPGFTIQVNINGSQPRLNNDGEADPNLPHRPALAQGVLNVKVPPYTKKLAVSITPVRERVSPGVQTSAEVSVKDANGKPVSNAEVALIVVDEAILALSSYAMASPLSVFYKMRPPGVTDYHSRTYIQLLDPVQLEASNQMNKPKPASSPGGSAMRTRGLIGSKDQPASLGMIVEEKEMAKSEMPLDEAEGFGSGVEPEIVSGQKIAVRTNFNPLAAFAPAVKTNAQGIAKLTYNMPDNVTRYRIMAVAVKDASHYGTGEANVTARLPIMVRPSAPRFLNFGDKLEVPVVIQNQTDEELSVSIAARGSNITYIGGTKNTLGLKVTVPANERVEVRFPATTDEAGTARFQFGAIAGTHADAAEVSIPVWTPATSEAFATYGVIDDGAITQAVRRPTEVWPQFGGIEVSTSSTALQALTDAFLYLYHYEYQCAEQISSRMVSVAALRDVLTAFEAEGMPTKSEIEKSMKRDIKELAGRQNSDGGFGFWRRGQRSWPYISIHAAHALVRAEQKGYSVPNLTRSRFLSHLEHIEKYIPHWYSERSRRHIIAYALYVRGVAGDKDPASARELISRAMSLKNLSFESVGWLLGVLTGDPDSLGEITKIRTFLNNRVTETAGNAHFASNTTDGDYVILHSDRVADGVILESLISDQPDSDLIPKIVSGLMAHRKKGRWGNTQENAFVLLALDKYFNTYEKKTPNFVARVWLGDQYAGDHKFKGRTTEQHQIDIPMRFLPPKKESSDLIIQKDGSGRMYYRIGMKYASKSLFSAAASHGFTVERTYEPVDNDGDVKRRNDGTWEIKAGAKIKVKLTMIAPTRRYHVALVDPLPAGLEPENPALAVVGDVPENAASNTGKGGFGHGLSYWWYSRPWYEHQNIRDERVEAFTSLLWGGVHTYSYYARATTLGQFIVPPAKAEEMYHPETFGRSASDRVDVVD